jgi:hypothetical protein
MDESREEFGNASILERGASDSPATDLSEFFKFPSLSHLFQGADRTALAEMRTRLSLTTQNLERVIRQGAKADADRALVISRTYGLALSVLDELERHVAGR